MGVECLVLTIGYSGDITKGLLNEYFFRDVRWVGRMLLLRSIRLSSVGLSVELKIALLPFLDFWLISLRNLLIAFLVRVRECLVMRARACFWAFFPMLLSLVIHSSSGGLVGGGIGLWR